MNGRLVSLTLGAAALTIASSTASAFVREESNWNPSMLPVHYAVNHGTIPPGLGVSAGVAAVEGAFASWSGQSCTAWATVDDGNTSRTANTGDSLNTIDWVSGSWPAELGDPSTTIGITTPVWTTPGYFIDADIQFNNVGFTWVALTCPGGTTGGNQVDAQSIATHEEGHFLGLGHSPLMSAIMYATYTGNCKRNLSTDDSSGVCTIYPRGAGCTTDAMCPTGAHCVGGTCVTPPPDAGSSSDPCSAASDCLSCADMPTCGWCGGDSLCSTGNSSGPVTGGCAVGWVWDPSTCGAPPMDSGTPPMGMGTLGDPCSSGSDCSSGVCVNDGMSTFCSRVCTNDCNCPSGYQCFPTTDGSQVCAPGTNSCSTMPDSGVPPHDSGTPTDTGTGTDTGSGMHPDSGSGADASSDSGSAADTASGSDGHVAPDGGGTVTTAGCACSTTVGHHRSQTEPLALAVVALAAAFARRRRNRTARPTH